MWMSPKPPEFPVAVFASRPHWNKLNTTTEYVTSPLFLTFCCRRCLFTCIYFLCFSVVLVDSFVRWHLRTQSTPKSTPWFSTATSKTEIICFFFHQGWVLLSFPRSRFKSSAETFKRDLFVLWTLSLVSPSFLCVFVFLFLLPCAGKTLWLLLSLRASPRSFRSTLSRSSRTAIWRRCSASFLRADRTADSSDKCLKDKWKMQNKIMLVKQIDPLFMSL